MELKWYALYTKPRWEKKVADTLIKIQVENYCPLNKVVRNWSDRKKIIAEPLFTSYVFVRISDKQFEKIRQVNGVVNFVYWLGKPAVIRDPEIDTIRRLLSKYQNIKLEKISINENDVVRIIKGPLTEQEGKVLEIKSKKIKVVLPSLGFLMIAEVDTNHVEIISDKNLILQHSIEHQYRI